MRSIHCRLGVADPFGPSFDLLARSARSWSYDCVGRRRGRAADIISGGSVFFTLQADNPASTGCPGSGRRGGVPPLTCLRPVPKLGSLTKELLRADTP